MAAAAAGKAMPCAVGLRPLCGGSEGDRQSGMGTELATNNDWHDRCNKTKTKTGEIGKAS